MEESPRYIELLLKKKLFPVSITGLKTQESFVNLSRDEGVWCLSRSVPEFMIDAR